MIRISMNPIRRAVRIAIAIIASALSVGPARAQMPGMNMPMEVGHVNFQTSCAHNVQADFDQGVASLYSFWFPEARKSFEKAAQRQPACAIAYWGEAMADYEQIEGPGLPEGAQLIAGQEALAKARSAPRKTPREQAYIDAVAIIFDAGGIPDHDTRVRRFSDAMGAISAAYPNDHEATVIYAMSLLKDGMPDDPDLALSRKALTILNGVLKAEPDNPGIIHFIIHAADNPRMASFGLDAARRYAKIAPAAPHALHMPGHIFARLGLWDEDIKSNLASKAAAEQPALIHTEAQNRVHAMEFLQYAYLQVGRDKEAKAIAAEAAEIKPTDFSPGFERYHDYLEAGFPARQAVETRDWSAALALQPASGANALAQRVTYWAQAVAAGHLKDRQAAEQAEAHFRSTYSPPQLTDAEAKPSSSWAEVKAWTLFASGETEAAIALLRPVADEQDKVGKGEVELPAREMIGDMLRISGRSREALQEYRLSLQTDPGRFNTLLHAGEVAESLGLHEDPKAACQITAADKASNAQMSFEDFDQKGVSPSTWRQLSDRGCYAAAVEAAEAYLVRARFTKASEQRDVMFHIAQSLGMVGKYDEAALMVAGSKTPVSSPAGDLDWNTYLNGTWAFFKRDKAMLAEARQTLVSEQGHGNQINGAVLTGLLRCFDKPYRAAYQAACRVEN